MERAIRLRDRGSEVEVDATRGARSDRLGSHLRACVVSTALLDADRIAKLTNSSVRKNPCRILSRAVLDHPELHLHPKPLQQPCKVVDPQLDQPKPTTTVMRCRHLVGCA